MRKTHRHFHSVNPNAPEADFHLREARVQRAAELHDLALCVAVDAADQLLERLVEVLGEKVEPLVLPAQRPLHGLSDGGGLALPVFAVAAVLHGVLGCQHVKPGWEEACAAQVAGRHRQLQLGNDARLLVRKRVTFFLVDLRHKVVHQVDHQVEHCAKRGESKN